MSANNLQIRPITDPMLLADLAAEAQANGHRMVRRLIEEWLSGENRFERPGEQSYVALFDGQVRAACGLNIDPYANDSAIGRVRRLYVAESFRRRGIASAIINQLLADARGRFCELRLRTLDPGACAFYESLEFQPVLYLENCTHRKSLVE